MVPTGKWVLTDHWRNIALSQAIHVSSAGILPLAQLPSRIWAAKCLIRWHTTSCGSPAYKQMFSTKVKLGEPIPSVALCERKPGIC